jgi:hypothetical protein
VEKASSSLTGTSDDVDRKWRRSSMPHGVVEYEPQSSKRSSRCDLTCIVPASTGDMRALWTVWPFVRRQGASREGLEIAAGYSTLPRRAHFQTCLRPAPVSCITISEQLMQRTSSQDSDRASYDISAVTPLGENRRLVQTDELIALLTVLGGFNLACSADGVADREMGPTEVRGPRSKYHKIHQHWRQ